jgi:ATP phosphoribosyltransferase regulatory subunit
LSAFPTREQSCIDALEDLSAALLGVFRGAGYARIQPAIVQPAAIFVDRSGEEIRRRTLQISDPLGRELVLRPDLTIPACKFQAESGAPYPARLCYRGPAFRLQGKDAPVQFAQVGAELLGQADREAGDAEMMTLTAKALAAADLKNFRMIVGDLGLFATLVDALDVPAQWRGRLKRHFWRTGYFEQLLARMVAGAANDAERAVERLHALKPGELRPAIEALLDKEADAPLAGRTREEIAGRLMLQASDGKAPRLDSAVAELIVKFLAVKRPARQALEEIRTLTKPAEAAMAAPLAAMERRIAVLEDLGIDPKRIAFVGHFGRSLEYYTGFVFEFWLERGGGALEVAGGGRYDTLMESLGAARGTTAVGCALAPEKILGVKAGGR